MFSFSERMLLTREEIKRSVSEVVEKYFRKFVFGEMQIHVRDAVITLIGEGRRGLQVDHTLLEGVLGILVDIGIDVYANEIEVPLLEDTVDYVQRAGSWSLGENSCMDYLLKAGECMQREEEIAALYLHRSREKLLEMVPNELLSGCKTQLLENLGPCCCALLRSDNKHDLSKLYSLFCRVPEGLETMVNAFKEHVIRDCTPLVMRDLDAITDKVGRRDTGGMQEEVAFVNTVLELRDKFVEDIIHVFRHNALLHRDLKETFVEICNKRVVGNTSEEFLAMLCDMVLRKGGSSKRLRSDEFLRERKKYVTCNLLMNIKCFLCVLLKLCSLENFFLLQCVICLVIV